MLLRYMIFKRYSKAEGNKWTVLMENKANLPVWIDLQYMPQLLGTILLFISHEKTGREKLLKLGRKKFK